MKTFIVSYIISLGIMVAAWFPEVIARPFHILPRLAFYMAFPMAVCIGIASVISGYIFGFYRYDRGSADPDSQRPAEEKYFSKSA